MPRYYACDHCGRTGNTLGVYYPGKDISQPAVRLCQSYQGNPITPNCYHQVVELGEELGIRKTQAIMATDRQSPKNEGVQIRFHEGENAGNVILTETERRENNLEDGRTPYGEVVQTEHPLTGERIPIEPPDFELHPGVTKAEEAKGIINPHGADQTPLVDPAGEQGQAIADAAAEEQARRITTPVSGPRLNPEGQTVDFPRPPQNSPISPDDMVNAGGPAVGPQVNTTSTVIDPAGNVVHDKPAVGDAKTPAQVAADAQAKADAEEASTKTQTNKKLTEPKKAPAKKAPAKAAAKKASSGDTSPGEKTTTESAPQQTQPENEAGS